jgi:hypothetical protein
MNATQIRVGSCSPGFVAHKPPADTNFSNIPLSEAALVPWNQVPTIR